MNDLARQTLQELVATHGPGLCDDARRCEGLLRDFCGQQRREIFVLVSALKERVPADLLAPPPHVSHDALLAQLAKRLQENLALTDDAARWAVESWAAALGTPGTAAAGAVAAAQEAPLATGALAEWHKARLRDAGWWAAGVATLWAALGVSAAVLVTGALGLDDRLHWMAAAGLGGGLLGAGAGGIGRAAGGAAREALGWAVSGTVGGAVLGGLLGAAAGALVGMLANGQEGLPPRAAQWATAGATAGALVTTVLGAAGWRVVAGPSEGTSGAGAQDTEGKGNVA
jgi:hypothetical protein